MNGIDRVGIVGAGLMGRELALVFALAGFDVIICDRDEPALAAARKRLSQILTKGIERGLYSPKDGDAALSRIAMTTRLEEFADRQFVTEAVFEREAVKAEVYAGLNDACRPECIIATNTSTIPISALASHLPEKRRASFVGTHYFSPASRMKLVEVISGIETSAETLATTLKLCEEIGKTPIPVKDVPGFAVNRLLHVLMIEAVRLVEEDVASPADIDTACKLGLGHPMGPFELMDATTSSLCLEAQEIMHDAYGERFRPRPLLKQRVKAGFVGGRDRPGWRTAGPNTQDR